MKLKVLDKNSFYIKQVLLKTNNRELSIKTDKEHFYYNSQAFSIDDKTKSASIMITFTTIDIFYGSKRRKMIDHNVCSIILMPESDDDVRILSDLNIKVNIERI